MVTGLHLQSTSGTDLRYVQTPGSDGSCDQDRSLAGLEVAQRLLAFFLQAISAKNKTRMSWNPGIPRISTTGGKLTRGCWWRDIRPGTARRPGNRPLASFRRRPGYGPRFRLHRSRVLPACFACPPDQPTMKKLSWSFLCFCCFFFRWECAVRNYVVIISTDVLFEILFASDNAILHVLILIKNEFHTFHNVIRRYPFKQRFCNMKASKNIAHVGRGEIRD